MFFPIAISFVLAQLPSKALRICLASIADVIASGQLQVRQAAT